MEGPSHLVSLKVMRLSRPSLATSSEPFFSTSQSFSAHSTASIVSLQGPHPLPDHPETLRDFSLSEVLTLPATFGSIQLGQTFSSSLCVNNEANMDVAGVEMKVEMQTATSKVLLQEVGGGDKTLKPNEILETVAHSEIKELGQHVLICSVSYNLPSSIRGFSIPPDDPTKPYLRTFRKYYKFMVTNPLSVKTKVHTSRSPTALMSRAEREKVFLEVHVQNLTPEPMWIERMRFECVEGWSAADINFFDGPPSDDGKKSRQSIFSGATAVMQPQDLRQYLYILSPSRSADPIFPVFPQPGSVISLGRLDISWRTSFGEPGRLLTSILSRRVPLQPINNTISAIPPHLQQRGAPQTPRSRSPAPVTPSAPTSRPSSPSPFKPRVAPVRPQSPAQQQSQQLQNLRPDIEVDLVVTHIPREEILLDEPFIMKFSLAISAVLPAPPRHRLLTLVVQHIQPSSNISTPVPEAYFTSPRTAFPASASPTDTPRRGHFSFGEMALALSPETHPVDDKRKSSFLPPPFSVSLSDETKLKQRIVFLGSSATYLPPFRLSSATETSARGEASYDFELEFMPVELGFSAIGGLRVVVAADKELLYDEEIAGRFDSDVVEGRVIREWDVVGEVWVKGQS